MAGTDISQDQAVDVARQAVLMPSLPVAAYLVKGLDGQRDYFLVHLGVSGGPGAAVMVDASNGSVMERVVLSSVEQPWLLSRERAVAIASASQPTDARLVWKPSRASRSPFYPLWEISSELGTTWVSQSETVWSELSSGMQG